MTRKGGVIFGSSFLEIREIRKKDGRLEQILERPGEIFLKEEREGFEQVRCTQRGGVRKLSNIGADANRARAIESELGYNAALEKEDKDE